MNLYLIDVNIVGSAYIMAETPEEALEIAKREFSDEHSHEFADDELVNSDQFSPEMPVFSLSPAMTFQGVAEETAELIEEFDDEDEA